MAELTLRLTGRPKIERDSSGLRKITRTYIVQGSSVTQEKIEEEVFLPYGTPDEEYNETITQDLTNGGLTDSEVTGAYLVQQEVAPGNSMSESTLVRVYQELDANSEPVKVGNDKVVRGENDRLTVAKSFIVKNPYDDQYAQNRIGVDSITLQGSECFLGSVQSEVNEVFTQFTETYYQDGILSQSVAYRYGQYPNHKLEIRTVRSVAQPVPPAEDEGPGEGPWVRVESKEGPGNKDYGQSGKTIKTIVFAKGEGLIKTSSQVKGKEPNTVEVLTIQYLTGEDGEVPDEEIPNFTRRTLQSVDEKEGYEIHTIGGVVLSSGSGVVDVRVEYKFGSNPNHKLEVANVSSYGVPATSQDIIDFVYPDGDTTSLGNYVLISEREDTKDEIDVYTSVFARGSGTIGTQSRKVGLTTVSETTSLHPTSPPLRTAIEGNELKRDVSQLEGYQKLVVTTTTELSGVVDFRSESKNNGKLNLITKTQLGSEWDENNTPASYVQISTRSHSYDTYPAITRVYADGSGVIQSSVRQVGLTEVTEEVILYRKDTEVSSNLLPDELKKEIRQESGYKVVTVSKTSGNSGIVDQKTQTKNNGALTIKTITQIGSSWTSGDYGALISDRSHTYDIYPAITRVYAIGEGQVSSNFKKLGNTTVTETISISPEKPDEPSDVLSFSIQNEDGYYLLKVSEITSSNKIVDVREEKRLQGNLIFKTITILGSSWDRAMSPLNYYEQSSRKHTYENMPAITKTFIKGNGVIASEEREDNFFTKNRITYLSQDKNLPAGSIPKNATGIKKSTKDGYYLYEYTLVEGHNLITTDFSWSGGAIQQNYNVLNAELPLETIEEGFTLINKKVEQIDSVNFINKYSYLKYGEFLNERKSFSPGLLKTTEEVFVDELPDDREGIVKISQISDTLYKNTVEKVELTPYEKVSKSYRRGIKLISTRSFYEDEKHIPPSDGFESFENQQVENKLHLVSTTEAVAEGNFIDERINYGRLKTSRVKTVIEDSPYLFDNFSNDPDVSSTTINIGKEGVTSLNIVKETNGLFSKTFTKEEPSKFSEVKCRTQNGGGVIIKETSTLSKTPAPSGVNGSTVTSSSFVDDNLGSIVTTTKYSAGPWSAASSKSARALTVETTEDIYEGSISGATDSFGEEASNSGSGTEFNYRVEQIAPGIFKRIQTKITRTTEQSNLREDTKYVVGGVLRSASKVGESPNLPGTEVSSSVTYDIIDGIAVNVYNKTSFEGVDESYTMKANRPFGMPAVAGIDSGGLFVKGGYSTHIAAKAEVKITTSAPNEVASAYSSPSATLSYTATPAGYGLGAMSKSETIQNCVTQGNGFNRSNTMFKGVYCSDVSSTVTGLTESEFKSQLRNKVISSSTQIVATYGSKKVYKTTTWKAT